MRNTLNKNHYHDPRINYRGVNASRIDNLTDAVFGIAITLLIFNLSNPNSFSDLLAFTKSLPAFLISIAFLVLVWREHLRFTEIYTLNDSVLILLNTLFISLVIFYVYPLRFLSLFLTNIFFQSNLELVIRQEQVPLLMIYYGFVAFALYFILFLFYHRVYRIKEKLTLNKFEIFHTKSQKNKHIIMFSIPIISILLVLILSRKSPTLASMIGGFAYSIYGPTITLWYIQNKKKSRYY